MESIQIHILKRRKCVEKYCKNGILREKLKSMEYLEILKK